MNRHLWPHCLTIAFVAAAAYASLAATNVVAQATDKESSLCRPAPERRGYFSSDVPYCVVLGRDAWITGEVLLHHNEGAAQTQAIWVSAMQTESLTPLRAPALSTLDKQTAAAVVATNTLVTSPLPDGPSPQKQNDQAVTKSSNPANIVSRHSEHVPAGWLAPRLSARDKVVAGLQNLYSVKNLAAIPVSASFQYIFDEAPNYSPSDAFGKRLGAAAIRDTSQTLFTDVVFSPLLREDARYYQRGNGHGFIPRILYAITRPLITRTDSGGQSINGALLLGYAGAAALTPTYYPSINRNFHDTAATFGISIGGAALGFLVGEFSSDAFRAFGVQRHSE